MLQKHQTSLPRRTGLATVACSLALVASMGAQQTPRSVPVTAGALRANASQYTPPEYPESSATAKHTGRVVVEVVVGTNTPTSPLARVQSSRVVESPDALLANAVVVALKDARYMPYFDESGAVVRASSTVVWDFQLSNGIPAVIDPYAPKQGAARTPSEIASLDLRIVDRARELLGSASVWNRHDTRQCPPNALTVSLYCALELATLDVARSFDHRGTVMDDARTALDSVVPGHPDYGHWLMDYNNAPATTFADIERVLAVTRRVVARRAQ